MEPKGPVAEGFQSEIELPIIFDRKYFSNREIDILYKISRIYQFISDSQIQYHEDRMFNSTPWKRTYKEVGIMQPINYEYLFSEEEQQEKELIFMIAKDHQAMLDNYLPKE